MSERRQGSGGLTAGNLSDFIAGRRKYLPIHLYRLGDRVKVAVEVNGKWIEVIDECHDGQFSHIVESGGIEKCIALQSTGDT